METRNRYFSAVSNTNHIQPVYNYVWDSSAVITGANPPVTGAWRPSTAQDMGGTIGTSGTPSITATGGISPTDPSSFTGIALAANSSRTYWFIQNTSQTGSLYVRLGSPVASNAYNFILNPAPNAFSAGGGSYEDAVGRWKGAIYVSGRGTYTAWEL